MRFFNLFLILFLLTGLIGCDEDDPDSWAIREITQNSSRRPYGVNMTFTLAIAIRTDAAGGPFNEALNLNIEAMNPEAVEIKTVGYAGISKRDVSPNDPQGEAVMVEVKPLLPGANRLIFSARNINHTTEFKYTAETITDVTFRIRANHQEVENNGKVFIDNTTTVSETYRHQNTLLAGDTPTVISYEGDGTTEHTNFFINTDVAPQTIVVGSLLHHNTFTFDLVDANAIASIGVISTNPPLDNGQLLIKMGSNATIDLAPLDDSGNPIIGELSNRFNPELLYQIEFDPPGPVKVLESTLDKLVVNGVALGATYMNINWGMAQEQFDIIVF